jgi:hypothetical protein
VATAVGDGETVGGTVLVGAWVLDGRSVGEGEAVVKVAVGVTPAKLGGVVPHLSVPDGVAGAGEAGVEGSVDLN